ncbi:hypothetical protein Hanom_Chr14g01307571 [Helianthus anomalus]
MTNLTSFPVLKKHSPPLDRYQGAVCFLRDGMSAVCGPHLLTSVEKEVDQTSAVCKKKAVCFFNVCRLLK